MTAALAVEALTAGYGGPPVIETVNLMVAPATIAVIVGPNGAGKSTLLKSVFALTKITSGRIVGSGKTCSNQSTGQSAPL